MRHLTLNEVLELYGRVMEQSGGSVGIYDLGALESALAQPRMTFGGEELYPTIVEKASALIGRTSNAIALPSRLSGLTYLPGMVYTQHGHRRCDAISSLICQTEGQCGG